MNKRVDEIFMFVLADLTGKGGNRLSNGSLVKEHCNLNWNHLRSLFILKNVHIVLQQSFFFI